jgi:DUF1016 N-terminal domain
LSDVRDLILQARQGVARAVNSGLVTLYWHVGWHIQQDIFHQKRAGYGEKIVSALGSQLERECGRGYGEKNLRRMIQFAGAFPDREIVVSLLRQLGWTHFLRLIPIDDPFKRDYDPEDSTSGWRCSRSFLMIPRHER